MTLKLSSNSNIDPLNKQKDLLLQKENEINIKIERIAKNIIIKMEQDNLGEHLDIDKLLIEEIQISDEKHQYLVAEKILNKNPKQLAYIIDKFQKINEIHRYEFANKIIDKIPNYTHCSFLSRCKLSNEDLKYKIAMKIFEKDLNRFAKIMQFLNLSDKKISELIDTIIANDLKSFVLNIEEIKQYKNITFTKEKLSDIADKLMERFPDLLALNIDHFEFSDEKLLETAQKLIEKAPKELTRNIRKFRLSHKNLFSFVLRLYKMVPKELIENFDNFFRSGYTDQMKSIQEKLLLLSPSLICFPFCISIQNLLKEFPLLKDMIGDIQNQICKSLREKKYSNIFKDVDKLIFGMIYQSYLINPQEFKLLIEKSFTPINSQKKLTKKTFDHSKFKEIYFLIYFMDLPPETKETFIQQFNCYHRCFRDGRNLKLFVELLKELIFEHNFTSKQRKNILSQIFDKTKDQLDLKQRLSLLITLIQMKAWEKISEESFVSAQELEQIYSDIFFKELQIKRTKELLDNFEKNVLKKFRDPSSILVYLSKILMLPEKEKNTIFSFYKEFILSIIDGKEKYDEFRLIKDPHLKKLREEFNVSKELIEKWVFINKSELLTFEKISDNAKPKNEIFKEFLKDRLIHNKHIINLESKCPSTYEFLTTDKTVDECISLFKKSVDEKSKKEKDYQLDLELLLSCKDPSHDFVLLENIITKDPDLLTFKTDIIEFKALSSNNKSLTKTKLIIEVSKDPQDILQLGRETGGCQNIDANPSVNKCLLGYVVGKNRIIAIKDQTDGKMVGRCIARLLWDDTAKIPVIFIEKVYSLNPDPQVKESLLMFASKIAKEMGLKLVISKCFFEDPSKQEKNSYPNELFSYGFSDLYEYSDSSERGITDGEYNCTGILFLDSTL